MHYKFDLVMLNLMALPYAGNTLSVTTQIYLYKWLSNCFKTVMDVTAKTTTHFNA